MFHEVVLNLYPIIIYTYDENSLKKILNGLSDKIKILLKSKYLYENANFNIRTTDGQEYRWKLSEIIDISY